MGLIMDNLNELAYFKNIKSTYELAILYRNNKLMGIIFEKNKKKINILCQTNDIIFWIKNYTNIINFLNDNNILYIIFKPLYKAIIIEKNKIINEVDSINLQECLEKLNQNIKSKIFNEKKRIRKKDTK